MFKSYMVTLNLATKKIKDKMVKEIMLSLIKDVLLLLLFAVLINAIFIFISYKTLIKDFELIKSQKNLIRMQNQPFNLEVSEINQRMNKINQIQKEYTKWSEIIIKLNKLIPENITISDIEFNKTNNGFIIVGTAKHRQNFITLKENLETSNIVFNISSPLSNLLHQENLNFSLTGNLILEENE